MILVTGGLDMIGAHTARALVDLGHEVVVTAHRRTGVPSFLAGRVTVEPLDVTDRDALLALAGRHGISDIVHLAGSIPDEDPVYFVRTETTGLLNALDAARTWGVRRFAVASSIGVYAGRTEARWHEELALPTAELPHLIVAFKKAVEPLTTHSLQGSGVQLQGSGVQPVVLRIGTIWGPLIDPESPFFPIPSYINAVLRGEEPRPLYADDGDAPVVLEEGRWRERRVAPADGANSSSEDEGGAGVGHTELVDEGRGGHVVADFDTEEPHPGLLGLFRKLDEFGSFGAAGHTPGTPVVDHHDLPPPGGHVEVSGR